MSVIVSRSITPLLITGHRLPIFALFQAAVCDSHTPLTVCFTAPFSSGNTHTHMQVGDRAARNGGGGGDVITFCCPLFL